MVFNFDVVSDLQGNEWGMLRSGRIGRSSYKEQYVYAYRLGRARLTGSYQVRQLLNVRLKNMFG